VSLFALLFAWDSQFYANDRRLEGLMHRDTIAEQESATRHTDTSRVAQFQSFLVKTFASGNYCLSMRNHTITAQFAILDRGAEKSRERIARTNPTGAKRA